VNVPDPLAAWRTRRGVIDGCIIIDGCVIIDGCIIGDGRSIGSVPTMEALHRGHRALVERYLRLIDQDLGLLLPRGATRERSSVRRSAPAGFPAGSDDGRTEIGVIHSDQAQHAGFLSSYTKYPVPDRARRIGTGDPVAGSP
jgi:hypothetical protein